MLYVWFGNLGVGGLLVASCSWYFFGSFGLIGLVNETNIKSPLPNIKVARDSPELHLGTIPSWVGSSRV